MIDHAGRDLGQLASGLFVPRERWGWEYVQPEEERPAPERRQEPQWIEPPLPDLRDLEFKQEHALRQLPLRAVIIGGLLVAAYLVEGAGSIPKTKYTDAVDLSVFAAILAAIGVLLALLSFTPILVRGQRIASARAKQRAQRQQEWFRHSVELKRWEQAVESWDAQERERVEREYLWYPLEMRSRARRVDVVGGTTEGWSCLLTTMGSSALEAGSSLLVIDFTESGVGEPLAALARARQLHVHELQLPEDLEQAHLLEGLDAEAVAELLGSALHALRGEAGSAESRMLDVELLKGVASRLEDPVTFGRLLAGILALQRTYDVTAPDGLLSQAELTRLTEYLDVIGESERVHAAVQFLRGALDLLVSSQVGGPGTRRPGLFKPGGLTVLETSDLNPRRRDLLDRLVTQAVLHHLRPRTAYQPGGVLVLVGADHLGYPTLSLVARRARQAGVRLVLMLEHLRGEEQQLLGDSDSVSIIMRLGNAQEAAAAAEFIGRGHSFLVTQLTRQFSDTRTTGESTTTGVSTTVSDNDGNSGSRDRLGQEWDRDRRDWSDSKGTSYSDSAQWGTNSSTALGLTDGQTVSRVYEFDVEPTQIQSLTSTAFLMVEALDGDRRVAAGSCDPELAVMDRVALTADREKAPIPSRTQPQELADTQIPASIVLPTTPEREPQARYESW